MQHIQNFVGNEDARGELRNRDDWIFQCFARAGVATDVNRLSARAEMRDDEENGDTKPDEGERGNDAWNEVKS